MRKLFVTGIGTDVGKTIVSAVIAEALKADYWKPIQSGNDNPDKQTVKNLIANTTTVFHPETFSLKAPLSPHAAAALEGKEISIDEITLPNTNNTLIIEGAGGLLVPLNKKEFIADLITKFDCEVILVVKHYLGSINHTLLSIEGLKSRNVKIAGIIFNGESNIDAENIILNYHNFKFIGRINQETDLNKEVISSYSTNFKNI